MYDIKLSTKIHLDKGQKIDIDFDIISHENAIMYKLYDEKLVYNDQETYGDKIHSGITKDKGRYFFFEHSIIHKPKYLNNWHSYYVYQITPDLFEQIRRGDEFTTWIVKFNSLYHFGKYILSVRKGSYVENSVFYSKLEGDTLTIPYGTSPGNFIRSGAKTIGEFLKWHDLNYKSYNDLILNKSVVRESLLESILF